MRIGFDVDGVLANFTEAYQKFLVEQTGVNLFQSDDHLNPPCWNWDLERGYTKEQQKAAFTAIAQSRSFWYALKPLDGCETLAMCVQSLEHEHDVYYVTNRGGQYAKRQTEAWLRRWLPYPHADVNPTVLISADKGGVAKALKLDAYIDDNLDNIKAVLEKSPGTRAYLLNRSYNQGDAFYVHVENPTPFNETAPAWMRMEKGELRTAVRVETLGEMLDAEQPNL